LYARRVGDFVEQLVELGQFITGKRFADLDEMLAAGVLDFGGFEGPMARIVQNETCSFVCDKQYGRLPFPQSEI
jgi:hypothetical protein